MSQLVLEVLSGRIDEDAEAHSPKVKKQQHWDSVLGQSDGDFSCSTVPLELFRNSALLLELLSGPTDPASQRVTASTCCMASTQGVSMMCVMAEITPVSYQLKES